MALQKSDRRQFLRRTLASVGAGVVLARGSSAQERGHRCLPCYTDDYDFLMPRVQFECDRRVPAQWSAYPGADRNLLQRLQREVRCRVKLPENCLDEVPADGDASHFNAIVDLRDLEILRRFPFLFITAEGAFIFDHVRKTNLKEYLDGGGFLLLDDCCYNATGYYFYDCACLLFQELYGPSAVIPIPLGHEVFHNAYDFSERGMPYIQGPQTPAHGVFIGERLSVFLSATDLHCGWTDGRHILFGGRAEKHEDSLRMGVNILLYAMSH